MKLVKTLASLGAILTAVVMLTSCCCDRDPCCPQPCRPVCCPKPVCCPQPCCQPVCCPQPCRPVCCTPPACCPTPCCPSGNGAGFPAGPVGYGPVGY